MTGAVDPSTVSLLKWRPVVACHILWHADFKAGDGIAKFVYTKLCRDIDSPNSRGIGIPVFFHTWRALEPGALLQAIGAAQADVTVVAPLVDDNMAGSDEWTKELESILAAPGFAAGEYMFLPVAFSGDSYNVSDKIGELNFLRLNAEPPEDYPQRLTALLTHELCRLLIENLNPAPQAGVQAGEGKAPVQLFFSHAKQDGLPIIDELVAYLSLNSPVEGWFDNTAISAGFSFRTQIEAGVKGSAMLIVHSDLYASREWCRREVLLAKKYQCPILVLLAVDKEEDRSFPYLGNVPTIRWDPANPRRCQHAIDRALREVLRSAYFQRHVQKLQMAGIIPSEYQVLNRPPEILTYAGLPRVGPTAEAGWSPVIYPDPPLGDEEVELLHSMWPDAQLTTPISSAHWVKTKSAAGPLAGTAVAVSISDSPDLAALGMGEQHLHDAIQEFARHILANGGIVAYGGDLRKGGFTQNLLDLVQTYRLAGHDPWNRIRSYVSWPIHLEKDSAEWAKLNAHYKPDAIFTRTEKPADLKRDASTYFKPDTLEARYAWARGLTLMREQMDAASDLRARVIMGGRVQGFVGRYPGVLEEALITMQHGEALYLCGGFGGAAREIILALKGESPPALSRKFQEQNDPSYGELIDYYRRNGPEPIDIDQVCDFLAKKGVAGLNNRLSDSDNEVLFTTPYITEIIYLVLKGLAKLPRAEPGG
jgi:hypothetical protein